MTNSEELQDIGRREGLAMQKAVDLMLAVMRMGDQLREFAPVEVAGGTGRAETDIAIRIAAIVGFPHTRIKAYAELIRMHEHQAEAEAEATTRNRI